MAPQSCCVPHSDSPPPLHPLHQPSAPDVPAAGDALASAGDEGASLTRSRQAHPGPAPLLNAERTRGCRPPGMHGCASVYLSIHPPSPLPVASPAAGVVVVWRPKAGFTWETALTEKNLAYSHAMCVPAASC